nr:hypothetical protein [Tanacetum cinerariifolium]
MKEEYDALMKNRMWYLVPRASNTNVVDGKWVYRLKQDKNGDITRYKARLVAKGFRQQPGIDFHKEFSLVFKSTTIRVILSLTVTNDWPLHQLDIQNTFLHGNLKEQAPRIWFEILSKVLFDLGFKGSKTNTSLFIYSLGDTLLYIMVYVDVIIVTDLGPLNYFLGIEIVPHVSDILLSQKKYILKLLQSASLSNCNPVSSPMVTSSSLSLDDSTAFSNPVKYRQVVGSLQYVTLSRPNIAFVVNKTCYGLILCSLKTLWLWFNTVFIKNLMVTDGATVPEENLNYPIWVSNDAHVRMPIISTISEASFCHVQEYADVLTAIGEPIKDKDLVMLVVSGLREEYNGLKTTITSRQSPTAFRELHALLSDHDYILGKTRAPAPSITSSFATNRAMGSPRMLEARQAQLSELTAHGFQVSPIAPSGPQAFYGVRPSNNNRNNNNNNRGNRNNSRSNNNNRGHGNGHQFDLASTQNTVYGTCNRCGIGHIPSANSHVTPDLEAMENLEAYYGDDALYVGNSKGLPILLIGSSKVYSPQKMFSLKNILHVSEISHNLLSVQKFCHDN